MTKTLITRSVSFHLGHRVPNHKSKCFSIHGHTYDVIIGVEGDVIETKGVSEEGMVIDFGDLKKILQREVYEPLDHGFMIYNEDRIAEIFRINYNLFEKMNIIYVDFIPTAENIAKWIYDKLIHHINTKNLNLKYVTVWETKFSSATYSIRE